MESRRETCFQLLSFRLEELAAGKHAERKEGPPGERGRAKLHIHREPSNALPG